MRFSFIFRLFLINGALLSTIPAIANLQNEVPLQTENLPQPQVYQRHTALDDLSAAQTVKTAQPTPELENQILPQTLALMKRGQWQQAKQTLAPLLARVPPSLHGLFLAGQIAEQQQDWQSAVSYYRKMLAIDSSLHRPRLELAKVFAKTGDNKAAEYQFNLVLSQQLPQQVEHNVYAHLQQLRSENASFNLQFALLPSSNINQGTAQRSVVLKDGRVYQLSESSRAKSGIGWQVSLDGEKRFGARNQWFVNASLSHLDYANRRHDQTSSRLAVGRSFGNQKGHSLDVSLGGHHLLYQHKGLYQGVLGRADYGWRLKPDWKLSLSWESQQLHYRPEYVYQRGWQHWLTARLTHISQGKTLYYWSVQQGFKQTAERSYSYRSTALQTGVRHQFDWQQLTVGGHLSYSKTDYRDVMPIFGKIRHDKRWSASVDILKRDWSWKGFAPRLSFHYTHNDSTIPLNAYKNQQIRLVFSKAF